MMRDKNISKTETDSTKKMKKNIFIGIGVIIVISVFCFIIRGSKENELETSNPDPEINGYVSNENTAIKVAEAIWTPIFGKEMLDKEKPFHATLKNDSIWVIEGTLPVGADGGTAYAEIQKRDCKILMIAHYK